MYFKRNVSIFHLRSEDVEVETIFFAVEERRVVHRLKTIWWSHADDDGDNGSNDNGENDDEGISPQEWPVDTSQLPSIPGPLPTRHRRWLGRSPA